MAKSPFKLNGEEFDIIVPEDGIKRSFSIQDGKNAGRPLSGVMERDILGTYYNYEIQIEPNYQAPADYDRFFEIISSPVDFHQMEVPYGQETLLYTAYIAEGGDTLHRITDSGNVWQGLTLSFIAEEPERRPEGYFEIGGE